MPAHIASFRLASAGCALAAGADSGTPLNPHGSLLPELTLMVKHGMTRSRPSAPPPRAAEAWAWGRDRPRRPGLAADLIAVAGDPAERIDALADVRLVLARGRLAVPFSAGG